MKALDRQNNYFLTKNRDILFRMRASSGGDGGRGGGRPQRVRQRTNPEKQIRVVVIRSNSGSGKVRRSPTSETGACF